MTSFTGPLKIKKDVGNSDHTTVIDASGTAQFSGPLTVTNAGSAAGTATFTVETTGTVKSNGPLKSGGTGKVGTGALTQRFSVTFASTVATTVVSLPDNSDIVNIWVYTTDDFTDAANATNLKLGIRQTDDYFATVPLSAAGRATATPTSAVRWLNLSGTAATMLALVTAGTTAVTSGAATVVVEYVAR